jgi:hypothetical protein
MTQLTASTTLRNLMTLPSPVLDDPAVMHGDGWVDQVAPKGAESSENPVLIGSGKA